MPIEYPSDWPQVRRIADVTCKTTDPTYRQAICDDAPVKVTVYPYGTFDGRVLKVNEIHPLTGDCVFEVRPTGAPIEPPSYVGIEEASRYREAILAAKEKQKMIPKKMPAGLKRFYVGSNNLTPDWTRASLKEALDHAEKLVTKDGYEEVFVVEIKRVVRKRPAPIETVEFKGAK